jgi:hypothetical protein
VVSAKRTDEGSKKLNFRVADCSPLQFRDRIYRTPMAHTDPEPSPQPSAEMSERPGSLPPAATAGAHDPGAASNAGDSIAWHEYQLLVDVYKFYLDLAVKFITGYFAIVGALVTVVLANNKSNTGHQSIVANALWVPILLSVLVAVGTWKATPKAKETQRDIRKLAHDLDLVARVHVELLVWILAWFPALASGVAVLLVVMYVVLI